MSKLFVIADDLTGALDTAVQFVMQGVSTCVLTDADAGLPTPSPNTVVVLCLPTRHMDAAAAYDAVYAATRRAVEVRVPYLYKKTDSVLRGNVGAELTAMLDASGQSRMDFLPAFPTLGRTTADGVQRVDGVPIHESVFRSDPFEPITESVVARIIAQQTDVPCRLVREGAEAPAEAEKRILVYDASTDMGLQQAAENAYRNGGLKVMAGCAGLAGVLGRVLPLPRGDIWETEPEPKLLVVCGSVNPVARKQVEYAQRHGFYRMTLTKEQRVDAALITDGLLNDMMYHWKEERPMILDINDDTAADCWQREQVADNLGALVGRLWSKGMRGTIMVTGGDTLQAVLRALRCRSIRPVKQLRPGVVLSECRCGKELVSVVSKAGGFGGEGLLMEIADEIVKNGVMENG